LLGIFREEPVAKIDAPFGKPLPPAGIAALFRRRNPGRYEPTHHHLRRLGLTRATLNQKIDQGAGPGQQHLAGRTPLAPVGDGLAVQRLKRLPDPRFEIEQRLQVFLGKALVGELSRQGVQAFETERELVLALGAMGAGLPERLQRGANAI
jgi:hypothetical protein